MDQDIRPSTGLTAVAMKNSSNSPGLADLMFQEVFEQTYSCPVCLSAKFKMVYGLCQHRICEDCLYDAANQRRLPLSRCPTCQKDDSFPKEKPDIPQDNVNLMYQIGVRSCPEDSCSEEMWHWEVETHMVKYHNKWNSTAFKDTDHESLTRKQKKPKEKQKRRHTLCCHANNEPEETGNQDVPVRQSTQKRCKRIRTRSSSRIRLQSGN